MKLLKSDIRYIGGAVFQEKGNCVFVFYDDCDYGVERIILRNLLQLFGKEYVIVSEEEYWDDNDRAEQHVYTNLPWDMFMNATKDND